MQVLVRQGDTISALAQKYLGSVDNAEILITYNNLEYPFIVDNPFYVKNIAASGNVTVTCVSSSSYTVAIGQVFSTQAGISNEVRSYTAINSVTVAPNTSASVPIACTVPGYYGNALADTVTVVSGTTAITATNPSPITGGKILRVLVPGNFIEIPVTSTALNTTNRKSLSQSDQDGGIDLYYTPIQGLSFTSDDLEVSRGATNVGCDVAATIATPLGSDPDNPAFGTLVPENLGHGGEYALQRLAVLSQGAANTDNRVQSVGAVSVTASGTFAIVGLPLVLNNGTSNVSVALPTGGA